MRYIEEYSYSRIVVQADDVSHYVNRIAAWAKDARPDMLKRNVTYRAAFTSIRNAIRQPNLDAYILRPDKRLMRGLATISFLQTVDIAGFGRLTGNQIDLSFDGAITPEEQRPLVDGLITIAARDGAPVFAALTPLEQERAAGVGLAMPQLGNLHEVGTPLGDQFGITARGPVQVFSTIQA